MNKQTFIIIGIILAIAAFLRFYNIEPFMTFLGDQGRDAVIIKRIVKLEHFPAIGAPSSVGQIFLGPFYYYLIAPFLLLFNFNPAGLGIGVAILTLLAMIYIAYEMNKEFGGFITTLFVAIMTFSFTLVDLSRFSWNPNLLPYFAFISLFFFYKWITQKTWIYAVLLGSFLAFSFQLHYLALFIFVPIGFYYIYTLITSKEKFTYIKQAILAIGAFLFFSLPLILFDIKNNFLNGKNFIKLLTGENINSDTESTYLLRLQEAIKGFVFHVSQLETSALVAVIVMIVFAVLSILVARKQKHLFITLNIILVYTYLFEFAFLSTPTYIHYFGPAYVSFYFILSFFVLLIPKRKLQFIVAAVFVAIFIWVQTPKYYFMTAQPANQIERARLISESFKPHITEQPIQIVALPFTETDGHFRYFLELQGYNVLPIESPEQPKQLFVMCFDKTNCHPTDDPHWQIASFYDKMLAESWTSEGVTIYKIIHKSDD